MKSMNRQGSALVIALIVVVATIGASVVFLGLSDSNQRRVRFMKIQNNFTVFENRLKTALIHPSAFICTRAANPDPKTPGKLTCNLNVAFLRDQLKDQITPLTGPGMHYFRLDPPIDSPNFFLRPSGDDSYAGSPPPEAKDSFFVFRSKIILENQVTGNSLGRKADIAFRDVDFNFSVPSEVTQDKENICPPEAPIFQGFDSKGNISCREVPGPCNPGEYVSRVDPKTLKPTCVRMPDPQCNRDTQYIAQFTYTGGAVFSAPCQNKKDPTTYWPIASPPPAPPTPPPAPTGPPAGGPCATTAASWTVGGQTCSGTLPAATHNNSASAADTENTASEDFTSGIGVFRCNNGAFEFQAAGSSCVRRTPRDCNIAWCDGYFCEANEPLCSVCGGPSGSTVGQPTFPHRPLLPVSIQTVTSYNGNVGQIRGTCHDGKFTPESNGTTTSCRSVPSGSANPGSSNVTFFDEVGYRGFHMCKFRTSGTDYPFDNTLGDDYYINNPTGNPPPAQVKLVNDNVDSMVVHLPAGVFVQICSDVSNFTGNVGGVPNVPNGGGACRLINSSTPSLSSGGVAPGNNQTSSFQLRR